MLRLKDKLKKLTDDIANETKKVQLILDLTFRVLTVPVFIFGLNNTWII